MTETDPRTPHQDDGRSSLGWFLAGFAHVVSVPSLILMASFMGFAGLAREAGITVEQLVVMVALVWAMPSLLILVGVITAGGGVATIAIAVFLSAVRLLPMVVAWVPVVRDDDTPRWKLIFLSHFVAVTSWVFSMVELPSLPRRARVPFFAGFAIALKLACLIVVVVVFFLVGQFPPFVSVGLVLLTPLYFLLSMLSAARLASDKAAMMLGLALGPVFYVATPGLDLLWTGLVGGTLAYGGTRLLRAWRRS